MSYFLQIFLWVKSRIIIILLSLTAILGFSLRVYRLDNPCLWCDELCTFFRVNGDMSHTFGTLLVSPFPPLYYIIMNLWTRFFGFSEISLRFPSMLFSAFTVIAIYYLAKQLFSEKEGIVSALLFSVSAYSINYAHEAKMYAMMWFFSTLSFLFFFLYVNNLKKQHLVLFSIFSIITIYTMYLGFLFLLTQNILFFILYRKNTRKWLLANMIILLSYAPWCFVAFHNFKEKSGIHWIKDADYLEFFQLFFGYISGIRIGNSFPGEAWFLIILCIISFSFAIHAMHGQPKLKKRMNYPALFLFPATIILLFILLDIFSHNTMIVRYIGFVHIPLIIIFSVGITAFFRFKLRWAGYGILIFLLITAIIFHVVPFHKHGLKRNVEPWDVIVSDLCAAADHNSLVLTHRVSSAAMQYYCNSYTGDIKIKPIGKITEEYIREEILDKKKYHSVFLLYRNKDPKHLKWIRKYPSTRRFKKKIGYIHFYTETFE